MKCPEEGRLFLYLEKELPLEEEKVIADHVSQCMTCRQQVLEIQQVHDFSIKKLSAISMDRVTTPILGQDEVWDKIQNSKVLKNKGVTRMKIRKAAIAAALVLSLGMVGSLPSVRAAASNLLQVFRVEQVDTLSLSPQDLNTIEQAIMQGKGNLDIEDFGSIKTTGENNIRKISENEMNDLGFTVKVPTNTSEEPLEMNLRQISDIEISPKVGKVNEFLKLMGSNYKLPAALEGQTCKFSMGDSLEMNYKDFTFIQSPSPQLEVPAGISVQEVAKAMVELPIWPEQVRRQLESVSDWEHTLLIPGENADKVNIHGKDGVMLSQAGHQVLIWQTDGIMYIAETDQLGSADLLAIAESVR